MRIADINKNLKKISVNSKSNKCSYEYKNTISKKITKAIKIKKITKNNRNQNEQISNKNINVKSNKTYIKNNENDDYDYGKAEDDDFDFMLKECLRSSNIIKNNKIKSNNNFIIQKLAEINFKNIKKKHIMINQHIESIELNSYINDSSPKEIAITRNKLNLNIKSLKNNSIINIDLNNPEIKNQFIHNNIANYTMLQKINFFERLKSISDKRYSKFKHEFQKDYNFLDISQFENVFIEENDININSPLTLIFHYCFNPEVKQIDSGKNFFEFIHIKRGDNNYSIEFNKEEIQYIPKYFNDINYVNSLFNNYDENDLNNFLLGINSWKKKFSFEQKFIYTKHVIKNMTLRDVATIYFISPLDMIIDYHSYGSNIPMADFFVAITQYRFHCDITFNKKIGNFNFKNSCTVYNTIKFVKNTLIKELVIKESKKTNEEEMKVNIWPNMKRLIKKEDKNNQDICSIIFETYLKNNLNKYSITKPDEKIYNDFFPKNIDNESIKTSIINLDSAGANFDIISNSNNEFNLFNNNINIINNIKLKEDEESKNNEIFNNIRRKEEQNEENEIIGHEENNENQEKKPKKKRWRKRRILKYGVCMIFIMYAIKTIISLGRGYFSNEKKFNIFLTIVIGLILGIIHMRKRRNNRYIKI